MIIAELVLASGSPYRRQLLESTGIIFTTVVSRVDETKIEAPLPEDTARQRAMAKAEEVGKRRPHSLVIGCDQVLDFKGKSLSKATNKEQTRIHLRELSGHTHTLHSAYCLYYQGARTRQEANPEPFLDVASVPAVMHMRSLTDDEIEGYIERGHWSQVVGCYRYEGMGVNLFDTVDGSQHTIIGLPLPPILAKLRKLGINPLVNPAPPWEITL